MNLFESDFPVEKIIHELRSMDYSLNSIAGREKLCIDISFFFFYYARYSSDEQSEEYAYTLLESALSSPYLRRNVFYATGLAGIGSVLSFLEKENFLEADSDDVFSDIDDAVANWIKNYFTYNYSFSTGLIGLCSYLFERQKHFDAINMVLDKLASNFAPLENQRTPIAPVFLFPSEILEDVKLFISILEKEDAFQDRIIKIRSDIILFEKNNNTLQSNCHEYKIIQQIRKARIENNIQKIPTLLQTVAETTSDILFKGLSHMYLKNLTLPAWWTLL